MCRIITACFQLVKSAHVATLPSPKDFVEQHQIDAELETSVHLRDYSDVRLYNTYTTL